MRIQTFLASSSILVLAACSDGGSQQPVSGNPPPPPPASTSTSVSSTGTITGFGSIIVNGERYEIDNGTVVSVNGETVTGDDGPLRLGMLVRVVATTQNGAQSTERVDYEDDLRGPARDVTPDSDNPEIGTFKVVGQTVTIDVNTVLENAIGDNDANEGVDIRDLDPVNFPGSAPIVVAVSGYPTDSGFLATRIDRINAAAGDIGNPAIDGDEVRIKGFVDEVASDGSSFVINGATIFVEAGTIFEDGLTPDDSLLGVFVEVEADIDGAGNFIGDTISLGESDFGDPDEFEVEGVLQAVDTGADPDTFMINGATIETVDASALSGLVGRLLEIEGRFNDAGLLVIDEVELDGENNLRTADRIASIDTGAGNFTTRLGLVITPTTISRISDNTSDDGTGLSPDEFLGRLLVDDYIEARGLEDDDESIDWTRIERSASDRLDCVLRGPVDGDTINDPDFNILDVSIDTNGLGFSDFENEGDIAIGRAAFFTRLMDGSVVEATSDDIGSGCMDGSMITAGGGGVEFARGDGVERNGPGPDESPRSGVAAEVVGEVRQLDATANTFRLMGRDIAVTPDTLFDDDIVEAARGMDLGDEEFRFGDLPEALDELISIGDRLEVELDGNGNALFIEFDD